MRSQTKVIVLLALLASPVILRADSIDDAEAKRRGVSVEAVQLEKAKERIASLEKQVAELQAKNAELQKKIAGTPATAAPVTRATPAQKPTGADGAEEITATKLETMGERYKNKTVKMTLVRFGEADNTWVDELPGVTISSNGLVSQVNEKASEKWMGFFATDSSGRLFQHFFASKKDYGDLLVGLKKGQRLNVKGIVVQLDQAGWYGLVCTKIEVVSADESSKLDLQDAIATAIAEHNIINGMTVAQAEEAILGADTKRIVSAGGGFRKTNSAPDGDDYILQTGQPGSRDEYKIKVRDGHIVDWQITR